MQRRLSSCASGALCSLFLLHCGGKAVGDPPCGRVNVPREASPSVQPVTASVKGVATAQSDGSIRLTLSPVVDVMGESLRTIDFDTASVDVDGLPASEFVIQPASATYPTSLDVVFVIDTSRDRRWSIDAVADALEELQVSASLSGVEVRYGGLEFSDMNHTRVALGGARELADWLAMLEPRGGGDAPRSSLDAVAEVYTSFRFRPEALRYLVVLTRSGFHEKTDGSGCSELNLLDLQRLVRSDALVAVVSPYAGPVAGVDPRQLAYALGGLFVNPGVFAPLGYDIAVQTPELHDLLSGRHLVSLNLASPGATMPGVVRLTYMFDGVALTEAFALN